MSELTDAVLDYFPANGDVGVPLLSNITITLSGLDWDTESLQNGLFVEGPDTDQYVGPGLISLAYPDNLSQGVLDDFLQSPGYQGIVEGEITVTGIEGQTIITFDPTLPFAALTEYRVNLTAVLTALEEEFDGYLTFSFTTGTGSIQELPAVLSTSVLSSAIAESSTPTSADSPADFAIVRTEPKDHEVQVDPDLSEITIVFNNLIDPSSVVGQVEVNTVPATDHPQAETNSQGRLAVSVQVDGNTLRIRI